jgi:hypothetical protein
MHKVKGTSGYRCELYRAIGCFRLGLDRPRSRMVLGSSMSGSNGLLSEDLDDTAVLRVNHKQGACFRSDLHDCEQRFIVEHQGVLESEEHFETAYSIASQVS